MSSSSFLLASLGFSMYFLWFYYHVICRQWQFYFISNLKSFNHFFFSHIALSRTSKIMLNKIGRSQHPCFVCDLRGKDFSFAALSMLSAMSLLYMAFIMLRCISSMPTIWRVFYFILFFVNGCWTLCKCLLHLLIWS